MFNRNNRLAHKGMEDECRGDQNFWKSLHDIPPTRFKKRGKDRTQFLPANPLRVGRTWVIAGRNLFNLWEEIENTWEEFFMR